MNKLSQFVKKKRKSLGLTQEDLSFKSGVGLRFVRDLEQGKPTLKMEYNSLSFGPQNKSQKTTKQPKLS